MPKTTELTATGSLANSDLLYVSTNTAGVAVSNSANVATLISTVQSRTTGSDLTAHVKFTVDVTGNTAFNFSGGGAQGSNNETLYVFKGFTYQWDCTGANVSQGNTHHFELRESNGGAVLGVGDGVVVVGNVITWTVPQNQSSGIVYQCNVHSAMVGDIQVS